MERQAPQANEPKNIGVNDVMRLLSCSKSKAYDIIAMLNKELESKGKITVRGRVSRRYLYERIYI